MEPTDPTTWAAPSGQWHPDFDREAEFNLLRIAGSAILARGLRFTVTLQIHEPGYASIIVTRDDTPVAEITIVLAGGNSKLRFGVFSLQPGQSAELYFDGAEAVADCINNMI